MLLTLLLILTLPLLAQSQEIQIHDFNNNNGYITLELDTVKIINSYNKILHIINITEFEISKDLLKSNILSLQPKSDLIGPMYNTLTQSLTLLEAKIENIKPHNEPHNRPKRGLANIIGKGLKYIAGTMDYDDEVEIKAKLDELYNSNGKLIDENNKQVNINRQIFDQIQNLTIHIRSQQTAIEKHINILTNNLTSKIATLEDEVMLMQYAYHINHDIILLPHHIDDIEQILFSSRLGILSKNILNTEELKFITSIESYQNIKITVTSYNNTIVIVLSIPQFSDSRFSKVLIEPIPDNQNKSLFLPIKEVLVDDNNNVYKLPVKENLKQNIFPVTDECINNIINAKEALCRKSINNKEEILEIRKGIVITKNLKENKIKHDCNKLEISIKGNYLIKFKNCKIEIQNKEYENFEVKFYDKIILPNFVTKIKEKEIVKELSLNDLYLENIENREKLEKLNYKSHKTIIVNTSISSTIVILFIITLITIRKCIIKKKHEDKIDIKIVSSEPQSNGGGVTIDRTTAHKTNII